MKRLFVQSFETEWGRMHAAATASGLAVLTLPGQLRGLFAKIVDRYFHDYEREEGSAVLRDAERQIAEYLQGTRTVFDLPQDLQGTPFQKQVLAEVSRIPYGRTRSYGDIARSIGNPGASRAVGMANARNSLPLVVPCHRVVAEHGLGGYGGGLPMKRRLLALEGAMRHADGLDLFEADDTKE